MHSNAPHLFSSSCSDCRYYTPRLPVRFILPRLAQPKKPLDESEEGVVYCRLRSQSERHLTRFPACRCVPLIAAVPRRIKGCGGKNAKEYFQWLLSP